MSTPIKWGNEIEVNTWTFGNQYESHVTALANGRFVVVWTNHWMASPGEHEWSVCSQIYNADGTPFGAEATLYSGGSLNTPPIIPHPEIAARPDGGYVVTWNEKVGGVMQISGQIFNVNGATVGVEFKASPAGANPVTSAVAGGNFFAVTWIDEATHSIRAHVYDTLGNPFGGSFAVGANAPGGTTQSDLTVTTLSNGSFVATWTQNGAQRTTHAQVFNVIWTDDRLRIRVGFDQRDQADCFGADERQLRRGVGAPPNWRDHDPGANVYAGWRRDGSPIPDRSFRLQHR